MAEDPSQVPEGGYLIVLQSNKTCAKASKPVCPPNLQKPSALEIPDHDWQTFTEKMKAACEKTWHPWKLPLLLFLAFVLGGIFLALVLMLGVGANPCPSYRRFSCAQDSSLYVAFVPGGVLILIGFCSYCILPLYLNGKNREHDMEILAACEELTSKCEGKYKVRYLAKNLDQVMAEDKQLRLISIGPADPQADPEAQQLGKSAEEGENAEVIVGSVVEDNNHT